MKGTCEQIPFHFFLKFMMLGTGGDAPELGAGEDGWVSGAFY